MKLAYWKCRLLIWIPFVFFTGCLTKQATVSDISKPTKIFQDNLLDNGKIWTFDFPPVDYFARTYHFNPTKEWFEKARLATLRLPGCTASFVSEDGLVMTNHHCARSVLDTVNKEGERLAEAGFYAPELEEERRESNVYVDQLIVMDDVTAEVLAAFEAGDTDYAKVANRMSKMKEIQVRYSAKYKIIAPQDSMVFRVVPFYNGGRYSLYGYKRYTDVRLVYAPEEAIAFYGGDPDNFTYPRYDFDCAFFRVYENDKPLKTKNFFRFNQQGAKEGDVVFVIGNPGSTNRLETVAQLEYLRDFVYARNVEAYGKIDNIYATYVERHPETRLKYMNTIFRLENSLKAFTGYLNGLRDPLVMARKRDFEKNFKEAILESPRLRAKYHNPWSNIAKYQTELASIYLEQNALNFHSRYCSLYLSLTADLVDLAYQSIGQIPDSVKVKLFSLNPVVEIEKELLAFQLNVMKTVFTDKNEFLNKLLNGRTAEQTAEDLVKNSIVASREKMNALLNGKPEDILSSTDPLITFVVAAQDYSAELRDKQANYYNKLQVQIQVLGEAMYEVYGTQISPDATFTLRIADGVIKGYEYNGTIAPPITTFFGMYDRYYSFSMKGPWKLPDRWLNPPVMFKMSTPMNFASTNDVVGGNSGSPVINKDLEVVGLVFDGNIESLPGIIIFDDTKNRSIAVHSAGLLEGLEKIYRADRLVKELCAGKILR